MHYINSFSSFIIQNFCLSKISKIHIGLLIRNYTVVHVLFGQSVLNSANYKSSTWSLWENSKLSFDGVESDFVIYDILMWHPSG